MLEQQVIPADDGVLDETVAGLRDFLLLLVSGAELPWVSDGDRAGEPIAEFDPVEKVLDRHAQLEIVDVAQDEHRFDDPTERLESGIKASTNETLFWYAQADTRKIRRLRSYEKQKVLLPDGLVRQRWG